MANNIIIDIDAGTKQFEHALDELTTKVKSTANQIDKAFSFSGNAERSIKNTSRAVGELHTGLKDISLIAAGKVLADGFERALGKVKQFGNEIYSTTERMQGLEMSMKSIVSSDAIKTGKYKDYSEAIQHAEKDTEELMAWFKKLSLVSPYEYTEVIEAFKQNANMGQTVEQAKVTTKAILELGSGLGMGTAEMKRFSVALAQTGATGKISAADLRQFANAGFGMDKFNAIFDMLSQKYGIMIKDHNDFNNAVAAGKLTTDDFFNALGEYASTNYGGAVEAMASTIGGLKSSLSDIKTNAINDLFLEASKTVSKTLKPYIEYLMELLTSGNFTQWGKDINKWAEKALKPIQKIGAELENGNMKRAIRNLKDFFNGKSINTGALRVLLENVGGEEFAESWLTRLDQIKSYVDKFIANKDKIIGVIEGIGVAFAGAFAVNKVIDLGKAIASINPSVLALTALGAGLGVAWKENLFGIQDRVHEFVDNAKNYIGSLKTVYDEQGIGGVWQKLRTDAGNAFRELPQKIAESLSSIGAYIKEHSGEWLANIEQGTYDVVGFIFGKDAEEKLKTFCEVTVPEKMKSYKDAWEQDGFSGIWNQFETDANTALDNITGYIAEHKSQWKTDTLNLVETIFGPDAATEVENLFNKVSQWFEDNKGTIEEFKADIVSKFEEIKKTISETFENVSEIIDNETWENFKKTLGIGALALGTIGKIILSVVNPAIDGLKNITSDLANHIDKVLELGKTLYDTFSHIANGEWDKLGEDFGNLGESFDGVIDSIVITVEDVLMTIADTIVNVATSFIPGGGKLLEKWNGMMDSYDTRQQFKRLYGIDSVHASDTALNNLLLHRSEEEGVIDYLKRTTPDVLEGENLEQITKYLEYLVDNGKENNRDHYAEYLEAIRGYTNSMVEAANSYEHIPGISNDADTTAWMNSFTDAFYDAFDNGLVDTMQEFVDGYGELTDKQFEDVQKWTQAQYEKQQDELSRTQHATYLGAFDSLERTVKEADKAIKNTSSDLVQQTNQYVKSGKVQNEVMSTYGYGQLNLLDTNNLLVDAQEGVTTAMVQATDTLQTVKLQAEEELVELNASVMGGSGHLIKHGGNTQFMPTMMMNDALPVPQKFMTYSTFSPFAFSGSTLPTNPETQAETKAITDELYKEAQFLFNEIPGDLAERLSYIDASPYLEKDVEYLKTIASAEFANQFGLDGNDLRNEVSHVLAHSRLPENIVGLFTPLLESEGADRDLIVDALNDKLIPAIEQSGILEPKATSTTTEQQRGDWNFFEQFLAKERTDYYKQYETAIRTQMIENGMSHEELQKGLNAKVGSEDYKTYMQKYEQAISDLTKATEGKDAKIKAFDYTEYDSLDKLMGQRLNELYINMGETIDSFSTITSENLADATSFLTDSSLWQSFADNVAWGDMDPTTIFNELFANLDKLSSDPEWVASFKADTMAVLDTLDEDKRQQFLKMLVGGLDNTIDNLNSDNTDALGAVKNSVDKLGGGAGQGTNNATVQFIKDTVQKYNTASGNDKILYQDMLQAALETTLNGKGGVMSGIMVGDVLADLDQYNNWLRNVSAYGLSQSKDWNYESRLEYNYGTHLKEQMDYLKQYQDLENTKPGELIPTTGKDGVSKGILGMLFGEDFDFADLGSQLFSGLADSLNEETIGNLSKLAEIGITEETAKSWHKLATALSVLGTALQSVSSAFNLEGDMMGDGGWFSSFVDSMQTFLAIELDEQKLSGWTAFATTMTTLGTAMQGIAMAFGLAGEELGGELSADMSMGVDMSGGIAGEGMEGMAEGGLFGMLNSLANMTFNTEGWESFATTLTTVKEAITGLSQALGTGMTGEEGEGMAGTGLLATLQSLNDMMSTQIPTSVQAMSDMLTGTLPPAVQTAIQILGEVTVDEEGNTHAGKGNTLYTSLGEIQGVFEDINGAITIFCGLLQTSIPAAAHVFAAVQPLIVGAAMEIADAGTAIAGEYAAAAAAVYALIDALSALDGLDTTSQSVTTTKGSGGKTEVIKGKSEKVRDVNAGRAQFNAGGGNIPRYATAVVGEHGPEILRNDGSRDLNVFTNTQLMDEIAHTRHALNMLSNSAELVAYNRLMGGGSSTTNNDNSQSFTNNIGTVVGDNAFRDMVDDYLTKSIRREMLLAR